MKCCVVEKVRYRPAGTSRLVWGIVLAQREGLTLLLVPKPNGGSSHVLAIAAEKEGERVFEDAGVPRFVLEQGDLADVGGKLEALGDELSEDELRRFWRSEDFW